MKRSVALVLALLLLTTCGGAAPIPDADLLLRVTLGAETVAPGEGFAVTVVRVWRKDMVAAGWDEALLSPLVLRLVGTSRREDERRIEETHRYRAYAFTLKDVDIPAPVFAARPIDGGLPRVVTAERIRIRVQPVLDPAAPGGPELPGDPPLKPRDWAWVFWVVGLIGAGLALRAYGKRGADRTPTIDADEPHENALARLSSASDVVAIAEVLRDYVADRFGVAARKRTSEELLAIETVASAALASVLGRADQAKFAHYAPTEAETAEAVHAAEVYVRETAR